jgi:hypothetical protein
MEFWPGDIVVCNCETKTWYQGIPGIIVEIDWLKDVHVLYDNGQVIRLARSSLVLA